jgi:UDP-glucuronate decarboxylase
MIGLKIMIDKSKSVLLIGSDGFLGNCFRDILTENGNEFLCYDIQNGDDICNPINLPRYDYVINCAGIASPEKYMKKPVETMDVSYIGTKNVLDYCIENKVESVLMFSSSEVYGTPDDESIPTKEDYIGTIPTQSSRSCYDIGKQVLETLCNIYYQKYDIPVKVVRPFNFYGPYMGINDNRVLSNWMQSMLEDKDIMVYGDGKQTRTFCYVDDGIDMCLGVLINGRDGEIYNVGNPTPELSMIDLASTFCEVLDYEVGNHRYVVRDYPNFYPKDEPLRRCPNIDKVVRDTGIQPKTTLDVGLKKMLEYFKENE